MTKVDPLLARITETEGIARMLEPGGAERASLVEKIVSYADRFLDSIYDVPAYIPTEDKGIGIYDSPISETPMNVDAVLELLRQNIDRPGLNPASGGHLGYIPGGGIYYSALGDYLADVTNRFAGLFFAGPGAVRMENLLIDWMANIAGYPATAGGNLTSGGSIANLSGIVAARDAFGLKSKDVERSAIYLTAQAHHSIDKAIRVAGLKECPQRYIPMDLDHRMNAGLLEQVILDDKKKGLLPWLIVASAGTTDAGAVDPLDAISEIARVHKLWLHVDGAYGAFFVLCEEGRKILKGLEKSDSLVMDPHKGLFLPYGTGAVLVREKKKLYDAFWYQASYLQDALRSADELSPADLSPELTKHFRGLRLWLPLKLLGLAPFRAALEEKLLLARYFHGAMREVDGFEVGSYPDLSVVTFRYVPRRGDANAFNERLIREVQNDGRVFLSSTMLDGKFILRVAILCFRTHRQTIDLTIDILREKAKRLQESV
ncbi:MAG: amino acid decarboxylase [Ignavibacteria bacterium]|nr:MAG: amino acid decarboxylase [Ignavibacteria bacterium]